LSYLLVNSSRGTQAKMRENRRGSTHRVN
jgi:hypothetical protein